MLCVQWLGIRHLTPPDVSWIWNGVFNDMCLSEWLDFVLFWCIDRMTIALRAQKFQVENFQKFKVIFSEISNLQLIIFWVAFSRLITAFLSRLNIDFGHLHVLHGRCIYVFFSMFLCNLFKKAMQVKSEAVGGDFWKFSLDRTTVNFMIFFRYFYCNCSFAMYSSYIFYASLTGKAARRISSGGWKGPI